MRATAPPRAASTRSCARSRSTSGPTASASTPWRPASCGRRWPTRARQLRRARAGDRGAPSAAPHRPARRHRRAGGVPALGRVRLDDRPDDRRRRRLHDSVTDGTVSPHRPDGLEPRARARVLVRRARRRGRDAAGPAGRLLRGRSSASTASTCARRRSRSAARARASSCSSSARRAAAASRCARPTSASRTSAWPATTSTRCSRACRRRRRAVSEPVEVDTGVNAGGRAVYVRDPDGHASSCSRRRPR